jgi:hypothetical protein
MKEDWKTPLGVIFVFIAFLIAIFVLTLPELAKLQTNALIVAAILAAAGVGLVGVQRWRK